MQMNGSTPHEVYNKIERLHLVKQSVWIYNEKAFAKRSEAGEAGVQAVNLAGTQLVSASEKHGGRKKNAGRTLERTQTSYPVPAVSPGTAAAVPSFCRLGRFRIGEADRLRRRPAFFPANRRGAAGSVSGANG